MVFLLMALMMNMIGSSSSSLNVGFYGSTCPSVEAIVRKTVNTAIAQNRGIGAGLIRLHFHDCFVRGCDGSVLLDSTPGNTAEKDSPPNLSLRGFEVIDQAKAMIEAKCPQTVSCSDILAFAARDSAAILSGGGISYSVPSGRRDGTVSNQNEALLNLPPPTLDVQQLQSSFSSKGLSLDEMVTLSGAHSIGVSHCSSFSNRLYSFNSTYPQDPSMDRGFAAFLKTKCPYGGNDAETTVPLDVVSPNRLDVRYYKNLRNHKGLFTSDQSLWSDPSTAYMVKDYANNRAGWAAKFGAAMVRMGSIQVLTGNHGEIRMNCMMVN
ncbi:Peroxidase 5 [Acorus gramineus]|uniref:Peroxidase n=1 Tax=Acorus gramineus TaxID=55184 RepID=A0AAV9ATY4_ACOGR|nr:Peroxidase 5 [Acorus gramineus]